MRTAIGVRNMDVCLHHTILEYNDAINTTNFTPFLRLRLSKQHSRLDLA